MLLMLSDGESLFFRSSFLVYRNPPGVTEALPLIIGDNNVFEVYSGWCRSKNVLLGLHKKTLIFVKLATFSLWTTLFFAWHLFSSRLSLFSLDFKFIQECIVNFL